MLLIQCDQFELAYLSVNLIGINDQVHRQNVR